MEIKIITPDESLVFIPLEHEDHYGSTRFKIVLKTTYSSGRLLFETDEIWFKHKDLCNYAKQLKGFLDKTITIVLLESMSEEIKIGFFIIDSKLILEISIEEKTINYRKTILKIQFELTDIVLINRWYEDIKLLLEELELTGYLS